MMVLVSLSFSRCVNFVGRGQVLVLVLVLVLKAVVLVLVLVLKGLVLITTLPITPSSLKLCQTCPVSEWLNDITGFLNFHFFSGKPPKLGNSLVAPACSEKLIEKFLPKYTLSDFWQRKTTNCSVVGSLVGDHTSDRFTMS